MRTLATTDYKIGKASEKIRQFLTSGEKIRQAQRAYDSFSPEELNKRLEFFANGKSGSDDVILSKIIDFNSCQFVPEDIQTLKQFLRRLDEFEDGDITLDQLQRLMIKEDLTPRGTEKLNNIERQKLAEAMKAEQRKLFELTSKQDEFDDVINILYENDMPSLASSCLKYRPLSLDAKEIEKPKYIFTKKDSKWECVCLVENQKSTLSVDKSKNLATKKSALKMINQLIDLTVE